MTTHPPQDPSGYTSGQVTFHVDVNGQFTEVFDWHTIDTLVRLGLIEWCKITAGPGFETHFYRPVSADVSALTHGPGPIRVLAMEREDARDRGNDALMRAYATGVDTLANWERIQRVRFIAIPASVES